VNSEKVGKDKDETLKWFWLAVTAIVLIWLFNAFAFQLINPSLESRAQNGDMFGPTNALFSGLAFAGLIYTIIMQRKELEMQRDELRMQREAMEGAAEEQAKQAQAQSEQTKELKLQNNLTIVNSHRAYLEFKMEVIKVDIELEGSGNKKLQLLENLKGLEKEYSELLIKNLPNFMDPD